MDYIISKKGQLSPLQKQLQRILETNNGSKSAIARHVGCHAVHIIMFAEGKEDALTSEQRTKLGAMIVDMFDNKWDGKPRKTAFYKVEVTGTVVWTSTLKKEGE